MECCINSERAFSPSCSIIFRLFWTMHSSLQLFIHTQVIKIEIDSFMIIIIFRFSISHHRLQVKFLLKNAKLYIRTFLRACIIAALVLFFFPKKLRWDALQKNICLFKSAFHAFQHTYRSYWDFHFRVVSSHCVSLSVSVKCLLKNRLQIKQQFRIIYKISNFPCTEL